MEFEFTHTFAVPPAELWSFLLDPDWMAACVPGMQSVEVVSDTEYSARIKVRIAFISVNFSARVVIAQMDAPHFLRADVTGQDAAIGSSISAVAEMHLSSATPDTTDFRVTARAQVLGRLGTLGLNPMRTKAESMWQQFCTTAEAALAAGPEKPGAIHSPVGAAAAAPSSATPSSAAPSGAALPRPAAAMPARHRGGLFGWARRAGPAGDIHVEIDRGGSRIAITFPADQADICLAWLDRQTGA